MGLTDSQPGRKAREGKKASWTGSSGHAGQRVATSLSVWGISAVKRKAALTADQRCGQAGEIGPAKRAEYTQAFRQRRIYAPPALNGVERNREIVDVLFAANFVEVYGSGCLLHPLCPEDNLVFFINVSG